MTLSDQIMQGALNARKNNPPSSSASSDGNDEAAMAVIMSLLEVSIEDNIDQSVLHSHFLFSGGRWARWSGRFQRATLAPALENTETTAGEDKFFRCSGTECPSETSWNGQVNLGPAPANFLVMKAPFTPSVQTLKELSDSFYCPYCYLLWLPKPALRQKEA